MEIVECAQGSDAWFAAKLGMVSSSHFSDIDNDLNASLEIRLMSKKALEAALKSNTYIADQRKHPKHPEKWLPCKNKERRVSLIKKQLSSSKGAAKTTGGFTKKAGRGLYMRRLAGERLSGISAESYSNGNMEAGVGLEDSARDYYQMVNSVNVEQVGFIKRDDWVGSSPDGLVGLDGGIEIKSVIPSTHIATIISGKMPTIHTPQVQGFMWVAERKWCDFVSYCPSITARPFFCVRVFRDEAYVKELATAVDKFVKELKEMINLITRSEF
jgi:hypothetical protein